MAKIKIHKKIIIISSIFAIVMSGASVWAGPPRGPFHKFPHWPGPLFELIVVGTQHLFFRNGAFYHKGPAGYVPVAAPEGAIIPSLPHGYGIRIIDDAKYYYFNGVYYVQVPDGYMVVAPHVLIGAGEEDGVEIEKLKGKVSVAVDMLNVRSGPGMKYAVVFLAYRGEILKIYHESEGWLYVELPSGKLGWVDKKFTGFLKATPVG